MEYVVIRGGLQGNRGRGRSRETLLNNLASLRGGISAPEMVGCTCDSRLWTHVFTNETWHGHSSVQGGGGKGGGGRGHPLYLYIKVSIESKHLI